MGKVKVTIVICALILHIAAAGIAQKLDHACAGNATPPLCLSGEGRYVDVCIVKGDITQVQVDTVVNAANASLQGGDGVCGAIFQAAGNQALQKVCDQFPWVQGGVRCPVGQAKITNSFGLKKNGVKYIIHVVGPDCRIITDTKEQRRLLHDAYRNALEVAEVNKVTSIAFPFISSGIYQFPREEAAIIALEEAKNHTCHPNSCLKTITFVLHSHEDYDLFASLVKKKS